MLNNLATKMATKEEDIEIIVFMIKLISIQVLETSLILLVSSTLDILLESLIVMVFLIVFRLFVFSNSWHLDKLYKCVPVTLVIILSAGYLGKITNIWLCPIYAIILAYATQKNRFYFNLNRKKD